MTRLLAALFGLILGWLGLMSTAEAMSAVHLTHQMFVRGGTINGIPIKP